MAERWQTDSSIVCSLIFYSNIPKVEHVMLHVHCMLVEHSPSSLCFLWVLSLFNKHLKHLSELECFQLCNKNDSHLVCGDLDRCSTLADSALCCIVFFPANCILIVYLVAECMLGVSWCSRLLQQLNTCQWPVAQLEKQNCCTLIDYFLHSVWGIPCVFVSPSSIQE